MATILAKLIIIDFMEIGKWMFYIIGDAELEKSPTPSTASSHRFSRRGTRNWGSRSICKRLN